METFESVAMFLFKYIKEAKLNTVVNKRDEIAR